MASFSLILRMLMGVVNTSNSCVKIELWSKIKHTVKQHVQLKQHDVVLFGVQDMLQIGKTYKRDFF
jgi:uncharacterized protein YhhL (DUF1145 family)